MNCQKCPVCGVEITDQKTVLFSYGPPGTRARLWARVCQFTKRPGCINQDEAAIGNVQPLDYYN